MVGTDGVEGGNEMSEDERLEAAWSLFRPVEQYPSEISLGGGITKKEYTNIVNTKISELTEVSYKATLFQILFIEGGEEEYVEGQWRVKKYYSCCWWNNTIQCHTPGQEGQENIFQE